MCSPRLRRRRNLAGFRLAARPSRPLAVLATVLHSRSAANHRNNHHDAHEEDALNAIRTALDENYNALEPEEQFLYRLASHLPAVDLDPDMVAASATLPVAWAGRLLNSLADAHLLNVLPAAPARPSRYQFSDAARAHAQDLAMARDSEAARTTRLRRHCDWALATATAAQKLLTPFQAALSHTWLHPPTDPAPFTDKNGALAWLDAYQDNLMAILRETHRTGWFDPTWQLADAMWPLFHRLHPYEKWIEAHELGVAAARQVGNGPAERQMLNSGAIGLSSAGRLDDAIAWYTDSLTAARAAGDARDEGQALHGLGACHRDASRLREAASYTAEAIAVWRGCDYLRGVALAMTVHGEIVRTLGNYEEAAEIFASARELLLVLDDPFDAARALAFHGRVLSLAGNYTAGKAELEHALRILKADGGRHWSIRAHKMLAAAAHLHDDHFTAREHYQVVIDRYTLTNPAEALRLRGVLDTL